MAQRRDKEQERMLELDLPSVQTQESKLMQMLLCVYWV